ncbi:MULTISPECIES: hypothetical protein [Salinibaculum]|uniref:hypothetical protein n=1 Tax=Salinibaculum TaxID=2732368 RepID=UPI0030CEE1D2
MSDVSASVPSILFTYVQPNEPTGAEEGESWYDTDDDGSYVYDGASWIAQNIVSHGSLLDVGPDNHHTRYTNEEARDAIGTALSAAGNISISVNDSGDTITVDTAALNQEQVEDAVAALLAGGNALSVSYDDVGNTLTVSVNEGQINHDNISGVSADDHHAQNHDNADHTTNYLPQSQYNPEADTHDPPAGTQSVGEQRFPRLDLTGGSHQITNAENESGQSGTLSFDLPNNTNALYIGELDLAFETMISAYTTATVDYSNLRLSASDNSTTTIDSGVLVTHSITNDKNSNTTFTDSINRTIPSDGYNSISVDFAISDYNNNSGVDVQIRDFTAYQVVQTAHSHNI